VVVPVPLGRGSDHSPPYCTTSILLPILRCQGMGWTPFGARQTCSQSQHPLDPVCFLADTGLQIVQAQTTYTSSHK
jgi:hypothetical protein